eukprot:6175331-Pleurochrysis_carterae.AAC.1
MKSRTAAVGFSGIFKAPVKWHSPARREPTGAWHANSWTEEYENNLTRRSTKKTWQRRLSQTALLHIRRHAAVRAAKLSTAAERARTNLQHESRGSTASPKEML